jgi:hypothetical protein
MPSERSYRQQYTCFVVITPFTLVFEERTAEPVESQSDFRIRRHLQWPMMFNV